MQRVIVLLLIVLIAASSAVAKEEEALKVGDPAPEFALKDADDKEYSLKHSLDKDKGKAKVIILIVGDRKSRKQGDEWAIELDKVYGKREEVAILMVADLRGLPFFVTEGMVKWGVKRDKIPVPILLDWGGKVSKLYKTQKGEPDLFVIDSEGKISNYHAGPCSKELTKKIQVEVQASLNKKENHSGTETRRETS